MKQAQIGLVTAQMAQERADPLPETAVVTTDLRFGVLRPERGLGLGRNVP